MRSNRHNLLPVILLSLLPLLAQADEPWRWQTPCTTGETTLCEVWFHAFGNASDLKITQRGQSLETSWQTYTEQASGSAHMIVLQLTGLPEDKITQIRQGLEQWVAKRKPYQQLGLYQSAASLQVLAPLGLDNTSTLQQQLANLAAGSESGPILEHLRNTIAILGSSAEPRRLLTWITTGSQLTAEQNTALKEALDAEKIRLAIVQLPMPEAAGQIAALAQTSRVTQAIHARPAEPALIEAITSLHLLTDNGGHLKIKTAALCGAVELTFEARLGVTALAAASQAKTSLSLVYPPCAAAGENQEGGETASTTPGDDTAESSNNDAGGEDESTDSPEPSDDDMPAPASDGGDSEESDSDGADADEADTDESDRDDEDADSTDSDTADSDIPMTDDFESLMHTHWPIVALVFGLLILLLVLGVMLLRNRRPSPGTALHHHEAPVQPTASAAPESAPMPSYRGSDEATSAPTRLARADGSAGTKSTTWGYLLQESTGERFALQHSPIHVGRSNRNDIVLTDDTISAHHAIITCDRSGAMTLTDLGSSNGTRVNRQEITQQLLRSGDLIELGTCRFRFETGSPRR
jgi:hypothetical protein